MRVVCMSDTHTQTNSLQVPEGDVLIHAGDFTSFGKPQHIVDFDRFLSTLPYKHKLVIAGNHEFKPDSIRLEHATFLQDESVVIEGIKIYGSKWQGFDAHKDAWASIPSDAQIVVTHQPPANYGDSSNHCASKNMMGGGCRFLLARILQVKPKYHIFGHIHEGHGVYKHQTPDTEITFINAAICGQNYKATNQPIVFDI